MNHNDDIDAIAESLRRSIRERLDSNYYGRRIYAGTSLDTLRGLDLIDEWVLDELERDITPLKPLQLGSANERVNQQVDGSALDDFFNEFATE